MPYENLDKYVDTYECKCELCDKENAWPEGQSGYESHGLRICEECYYRYPIGAEIAPPIKQMVKHLDRLRRELAFALAGHGPPIDTRAIAELVCEPINPRGGGM